MMKIEEIIRDVADTLKISPKLSGVPVIEEDKGNVASAIETAVAKTSVAVVVGWNGFTPRIVGDTSPQGRPFGTVTVVVSVFEKPVVNRTKPSAPRLLEIAREAAVAIDGGASEGMEDVLRLKRISPIVDLERGVVTCDVEFETKATL